MAEPVVYEICTEVRTFRVTMCHMGEGGKELCGGNLTFEGRTSASKYLHVCSACHAPVWLSKKYPYITYEDVRKE